MFSEVIHKDAEEIIKLREKCPRFRVLVVGKANAGKTTILQKVCNTTEQPIITDVQGKKISLSVLLPSKSRGEHDIDKELVFASSPGFVFHDSRGLEAGSDKEIDRVRKFVLGRAEATDIAKRLHAIWFCIPVDNTRLLLDKETSLLEVCNTGEVPVIAVFTKFDFRQAEAFENLENEGKDIQDAITQAHSRAVKDFEQKFIKRLYDKKYPPKGHVFLYDMHQAQSGCGQLIKATADVLTDASLKMLLISSQQSHIELCVEYAIRDCLTFLRAHKKAEESAYDVIVKIIAWFPRSKEELNKSMQKSRTEISPIIKLKRFPGVQLLIDGWLRNQAPLTFMAGNPPIHSQLIRITIGLAILFAYQAHHFDKGEDMDKKIGQTFSNYHSSAAFAKVKTEIEGILAKHDNAELIPDSLIDELVGVALGNML